MNVAEYGQGLREIGTKNLEALASLERAKQNARWETDVATKKGTAEAVGTMIGGIVGTGKGLYNQRKEDFDRGQQQAQIDWANDNYGKLLQSKASGAPMEAPTPRPVIKQYSFLDDMADLFHKSGFVGGGSS